MESGKRHSKSYRHILEIYSRLAIGQKCSIVISDISDFASMFRSITGVTLLFNQLSDDIYELSLMPVPPIPKFENGCKMNTFGLDEPDSSFTSIPRAWMDEARKYGFQSIKDNPVAGENKIILESNPKVSNWAYLLSLEIKHTKLIKEEKWDESIEVWEEIQKLK
jgi:hypothetical protein